MNNQEIAERIADLCCERNGRTARAVQSFVEEVVLPKHVDSYTLKEMEKYIFEYLEKKRRE
jgi:hypothetical protein